MKTAIPYHIIALDVSKAKLDCHCSSLKLELQIKNTKVGLKRLLALLPDLNDCLLCVEASGGYERLACDFARAKGLRYLVLNARRVREYAKGMGVEAKTDLIDARLIEDFVIAHRERNKLTIVDPPSEHLVEMREISRRRLRLVDDRGHLKVLLDKAVSSFVARELRREIRITTQRIARFEAELERLAAQDNELLARRKVITAIIGIAKISATCILVEIPELGQISDRQASALVGLAPFADDSGQHRGQRHIRYGRARARKALYMPAMSATTHNPILAEFYERLKAKGKPSKVALTAVMRKLICLINRLLADPDFRLA